MEKKDKKPPDKPRGEMKAEAREAKAEAKEAKAEAKEAKAEAKEAKAEARAAEKEAEKAERDRLKKDQSRARLRSAVQRRGRRAAGGAAFSNGCSGGIGGKLIFSSLLYIVKASPLWIMPLVTGDVIDLITARPDGFLLRIVIDAVIFAVMVAQNVPTNMWYSAITNKMIRNTTAGIKGSVIRKLQRLSITYHREMEGGKIQSKFLRDIDNVDMYYRNVVQVVIPNLIGAVISVGISLQKSPLVTLFFVAVVR